MPYPIRPPVEPMLAKPSGEIPRGDGWLYEPKWDGFRAIVYRAGDDVHIASRNNLPLERYFPEVVDTVRGCFPERCVVDGEIVIPGEGGLDFDSLQLRLHPAASRVRKLAAEIPASFIAFDALALGDDDLRGSPFDERRARLVGAIASGPSCFVTPQTSDAAEAQRWFERFEGAGLDGVIAKKADLLYVPGERVMVKVKHERTADCVVAGYRLNKGRDGIGSLVLGVYSAEGELHHLGFTSTFRAPQRRELLRDLQPLVVGVRDGGPPSRWTAGKDTSWVELEPRLVCEVAFDHLQGGWRFRHGARFVRWRADRDAKDCTFDQFVAPEPFSLEEIRALAERR